MSARTMDNLLARRQSVLLLEQVELLERVRPESCRGCTKQPPPAPIPLVPCGTCGGWR